MTDDLSCLMVKRGVDCIGVAVSFLLHDGNGKVLLHKRGAKCRDEQGKWDTGGGALEFGESFEDCLRREVKEEFCVDVEDVKFLGAFNILRDQHGVPTHWINLCHAAKVDPTQVRNGEPEKIEEMGWFSIDAIPTPQHTSLQEEIALAKSAGILY